MLVGWTCGAVFKPHRPQKRAPSCSLAAHLGHGNVPPASPGLTIINEPLPQRPQNLTPSANRELQLEHATMPGITLDCGAPAELVPCDDEGWLAVPCSGLSWAWITCSLAPSRTSITRSSSRSPAFETQDMLPGRNVCQDDSA